MLMFRKSRCRVRARVEEETFDDGEDEGRSDVDFDATCQRGPDAAGTGVTTAVRRYRAQEKSDGADRETKGKDKRPDAEASPESEEMMAESGASLGSVKGRL